MCVKLGASLDTWDAVGKFKLGVRKEQDDMQVVVQALRWLLERLRAEDPSNPAAYEFAMHLLLAEKAKQLLIYAETCVKVCEDVAAAAAGVATEASGGSAAASSKSSDFIKPESTIQALREDLKLLCKREGAGLRKWEAAQWLVERQCYQPNIIPKQQCSTTE